MARVHQEKHAAVTRNNPASARAAGIAEIPRVMQLAFIHQIANRAILEKHALVVIGFLITGLLNEGIFAVCRMRIALGFQLPDR